MIIDSINAVSGQEYWMFIEKIPIKAKFIIYEGHIDMSIVEINAKEEWLNGIIIFADSRAELIDNLIESNRLLIDNLEKEVARLHFLKNGS